jgi:hypothetical protein
VCHAPVEGETGPGASRSLISGDGVGSRAPDRKGRAVPQPKTIGEVNRRALDQWLVLMAGALSKPRPSLAQASVDTPIPEVSAAVGQYEQSTDLLRFPERTGSSRQTVLAPRYREHSLLRQDHVQRRRPRVRRRRIRRFRLWPVRVGRLSRAPGADRRREFGRIRRSAATRSPTPNPRRFACARMAAISSSRNLHSVRG